MNRKKLIVLTGSLLVVLLSFRLIWLSHHTGEHLPTVQNGVLDLRETDFTNQALRLDGEWQFYPWELIESAKSSSNPQIITLPGKWKETLSASTDEENPPYLYGTYSVKILLNENEWAEPFALYVKDIRSASKVFINGQEMMGQGSVAEQENGFVGKVKPYMLQIDSTLQEIDLVIQVADKAGNRMSGIKEPIQFGNLSAIERSRTVSMLYQILSASVLVLHFIFAVIIYIGFSRRMELLYLAVVFGSAAFSILLDDDRVLLMLFPGIPDSVWSLLFYSSYVTSVIFLMLFFKRLLAKSLTSSKWLTVNFQLFLILYILYIVLLLAGVRSVWSPLFSIIMLVVPMLIAISLFYIVRKGTTGAIYLLFAMICIANNIAWASLKSNQLLILPYYPFDLILAVIFFAVFWFKQFFQVTEESQALADRLQRTNDRKDEFLANTSHELRNPLHGIMNISQTIYETENQLSEENRKNMETLLTVSKRMSIILNDLMDVQKLKEGGIQLHLTDVDISAVASSVIDTVRFMTKGKDISFHIAISHKFPYVYGDENRLFQILFNLIHNAVKYTECGEIGVTAKMDGKFAVIEVKDAGIGIAQEALTTIFQPYEQVDASMTAMGNGLGLGLAICDELVQLHGGQLTVDSVVNEGSTFTFTIPFGKARTEPITAYRAIESFKVPLTEQTSAINLEKQPKILIVDDDPVNVSIIEQIMTANEFTVQTCLSGEAALELLNKGKWDLVITDVMMPRMSGYELTEKIRERFTIAELPILLLTARSQLEDVQTGFHYGANDYITKPVDRVELIIRVKALTNLRKALTERIAMEAAWLQAQIQPHFLFNTLNTIAALSHEDPKKMMKLIEQFGNYLNISFATRNLQELVPLDQELQLVKSYVYIELERFCDRLTVEWDVQVSSNVMVPPLAIQTLVENAIKHGVLKKAEGGTVTISIIAHSEAVDIAIMDDGVGIAAEKLKNLLNKADENQSGIGLVNTDKRLRQLFGTGLRISSEVNKGTTMSFTVPL
ncbi:ATP-binding protein [Sporosarcina oncorhynchi]|uniref:histidine kinase n=1 Tax=Sporosarcina oncorhynchi TaxID=3056444 RepID=A0ABZ0L6A6_9BACL|nr:ATP-binding protein [Sporosarcina sp. T2O-4]WOV88102.1 ATP-binding protein [Sporosarcina sp. T2O-4]